MPRGTRTPSDLFKSVLRDAQTDVINAGRRAADLVHRGSRGDERAAALARFLKDRLPDAFATCKGEAVDHRDQHSTQLDLMVYHKQSCVPVSRMEENMLIPCEGLYAVIESKTVLTQEEMNKAFVAAQRLRQLRPFTSEGRIVSSRTDGREATTGEIRCMYILFAYDTNLGGEDWLHKEFARAQSAAVDAATTLDVVDRIVVLNRGIINPVGPSGKVFDADDSVLFVELYLNLVNFLQRELRRRPPIDWQAYSSRTAAGWVSLR